MCANSNIILDVHRLRGFWRNVALIEGAAVKPPLLLAHKDSLSTVHVLNTDVCNKFCQEKNMAYQILSREKHHLASFRHIPN